LAGAWRCSYNIQKYSVAPDFLVLVYLKPRVYLIEASVMNVDAADAGVRRPRSTLGAYSRP
jgi:hypothetical protein